MAAARPTGLDLAALTQYLRAAIPDLAGEMRLEQIAGGQSNPTYFVTFDNRRLVLRKQPQGDLLPSAHAIDREYRIIEALGSTDVPVPRAVLYCTNPAVIGTPFYLMERVAGRVFHDCTLPEAAPTARGTMYRALASTLGRLHNVEPAAVGLSDFGRSGNYFARQIGRWTRQWQLSQTRADANIDRLIDWLPAHIPTDDVATLVHGDYRIGNAMFAPDGGVAALLDWELSTIGHPLADLAHCAIAWLSRPEEFGGMSGRDLDALGIPTLDQFEADYGNVATHGLRLRPFHLAFAFFRWSVIFEGIAARARAGNATDGSASEKGGLAASFAARAIQYI